MSGYPRVAAVGFQNPIPVMVPDLRPFIDEGTIRH
jgi:hypothetical protein